MMSETTKAAFAAHQAAVKAHEAAWTSLEAAKATKHEWLIKLADAANTAAVTARRQACDFYIECRNRDREAA